MGGMKKSYSVLMADDSPDDRFFIKRHLGELPNVLICGEVEDGVEAISYLAGEGLYADRVRYPFPDLLLLDLKMPRKGGYEVLDWIKSQSFSDLTVFVVSNSDLSEDRLKCRLLGASAFCPKGLSVMEQALFMVELEKWIQSRSGG